MPATTMSSPLPTLAGTASSQPLALWQGVVQANATAIDNTLAAPNASVDANQLDLWTAAEGLTPPRGQVFWLPTPASASAQERALEQRCRQQLMQDAMDGHTSLRVLYGTPAQQLRALRECLQLLAQETMAAALPHGHAPSLRCRECVDPASEQRLFSRLLAGRAERDRGNQPE